MSYLPASLVNKVFERLQSEGYLTTLNAVERTLKVYLEEKDRPPPVSKPAMIITQDRLGLKAKTAEFFDPKTGDVSAWYEPDDKPKLVGFYERYYVPFTGSEENHHVTRDYWDGINWYLVSKLGIKFSICTTPRAWRGMSKEAVSRQTRLDDANAAEQMKTAVLL